MKKDALSQKATYVLAALQCMSRARAQAFHAAQEDYAVNTRPVRGMRMLGKVAELDSAALGLSLMLDEQEQELVYREYITESRR